MSPSLRELARLHDAAAPGAVLKTTPRSRVTRIPFDATGDAVCKEDRPAGLRSRLGRALRGTRAARSQATARALLEAGFPVPEPLGVLEEGERSLYFARHVEGPTLSAALEEAGPDRAAALARAAAELTARLHLAGFAFRDLKPPNLVVAAGDLLLPVDLDDVSRPRRLPHRIAFRNLAALDAYAQRGPRPLAAGARWRALQAYARLRGVPARSLLGEVLRRSREKRRRWEAG